MSDADPIKILMLEDVDSDADLIQRALRKAGLTFEIRRETGRAGFEGALAEYEPDLILADFNLPDYDGGKALQLAKDKIPQVPVIMVTGALGDEQAVDLIKAGARDYVIKDRLARLAPAVRQALGDARERRRRIAQEQARARSEHQFHELLENVRLLAVILDCDGQITYANEHLAALTGWSRDDILDANWFDLLIPEESSEQLRQIHERAFTGDPSVLHHENEVLTRSGDRLLIQWDNTVLLGPGGQISAIASLGRDVTDLRRANEQLRNSEQRFRALIENATDVVAVLSADGRMEYVSPGVESVAGYTPEAVTGQRLLDFFHPEDQASAQADFARLLAETSEIQRTGYRLRHRDGSWLFTTAVVVNHLKTPGIHGIVCTLKDVTAVEEALADARQSRQLLETILDTIPVSVFWRDRELTFLGCNMAFATDAGFQSPAELIGKSDDVMPWHKQAKHYRSQDLKVINDGKATLLTEESRVMSDGRMNTVLASRVPLRDQAGVITGMIGAYMDITEHKELQSHLELARTLIEASPAVLFRWQTSQGWPVVYVTDNVRQWGYEAPDLLAGNPSYSEIVHPDDLQRVVAEMEDYTISGASDFVQEYRLLTKDGREVWVDDRTTVERGSDGAPMHYQGIVTDISHRKRDEQALQALNRTLRLLSAGNALAARARNEDELLQDMCRLIVDTGQFPLAWVGYARHDEKRKVDLVAQSGLDFTAGYLDDLKMYWSGDISGQGPTGRCIRNSSIEVVDDVETDAHYEPWRGKAQAYGFHSTIALPLLKEETTFGSLNIYSCEKCAFPDNVRKLLMELAGELAFGVRSLREREANELGQRKLAASLEATVRVLASTVEMRDPYTAGHQQRVSQLAVAIGRELKMNAHDLKGLALAASIHDVGKLRIPAEILAKPGSLTDAEYGLIKAHAETGRDLLTAIEFPWPIAEIVGQHHEHLDGSGYPLGLKGNDILLQARIIAVADVVEAMGSHRPYRAALGLQVALDEIQRGSGKIYDSEVVATCIRLFDNGFTLTY